MKLVELNNGKATTTSKMIADAFGKDHRKVVRDIEKLHCSDEFRTANFGLSSYISLQNKELRCYEITRDGFAFLAMGFIGPKAGKWKEAYINAFNEMEAALLNMAPTLETINQIVKRAESDKQIASDCGTQLAKYKQLKAKHKEDLDKAIESVQMTLGFN